MTNRPDPEPGQILEAETEEEALGARARSGLGWSLLNSAAARVLNVIAGLVIARVVSPDQFGTYAVALLVMTIVLSMNEVGLSVAVIRWKEGVDRITPTAVSGSLASSIVWFALMFFGAPLIAAVLNAPDADSSSDPGAVPRRPARRRLHDPECVVDARLPTAAPGRRRASPRLLRWSPNQHLPAIQAPPGWRSDW